MDDQTQPAPAPEGDEPAQAQSRIAELEAQVTDLQQKLDAATNDFTGAQSRIAEFENDARTRSESEIDKLLEDYDLPDAARAAFRENLLSNRQSGEALLSVAPKKQAPAPAEEKISPPEPQHNPESEQTPEIDEREQAKRIAEATRKLIAADPTMPHAEAYSRAKKEILSR